MSSGRSDFEFLALDEARQRRIGSRLHRFDRSRTALGLGRLEAGAAHGDQLDRIDALDGGEHVAGVNGPHECVGRDHGDDFGNLRHVEQGRGTRQDVLAEGGGRRQHGGVILGEFNHQGGERFGQRLGIARIVGQQHLGDAGDLGAGLGRGAYAPPSHQQMDIAAQLRRSGDGRERGRQDAFAVVLDENQRGHDRRTSALIKSP